MERNYIAEVTVVTKYEVRIRSSNETEAIESVKKSVKAQSGIKEIASYIGDVALKPGN